MAMDWTTLTGAKTVAGSVASWVNSDKVPSADVVADAENWLAQKLRTRRMEARADVTLLTGDSDLDLTSDLPGFLDPVNVYIRGYGMIESIPEDDIDRVRDADVDGTLQADTPAYYAVVGDRMIFDTKADQDYVLSVTYFKEPDALSDSTATNLYTTRYRVLFKAVAMGFAYVFLKDETRAAALFQSALSHIQTLEETDDLVRRGQIYDVRVV
jgi:hypothetical protein